MTKLQEAAKALYDFVGAQEIAGMQELPPFHGLPKEDQAQVVETVRVVLGVLRRPDMAAVMRTSGQIAMRPSDVDLAVTHYLDAILKEPQ